MVAHDPCEVSLPETAFPYRSKKFEIHLYLHNHILLIYFLEKKLAPFDALVNLAADFIKVYNDTDFAIFHLYSHIAVLI